VIYVGTCGFSYKDWIGRFYPAKIKPAEMLPYYARLFRAVEIDSSYYGVPSPRTVESMAARTPANFRFSFKLPQTVTHAPDPAARLHDDAAAFRACLEPMRSAGKLACALAQFPNAFKPAATSGDHVKRIAEAFEAIPLVFEFRNRLWQQPATTAMLRELGVGYCNADMPALEGLLEPSADVTSSVGYVRFHGRNARQWWRGSNVTRYEYAYSPEELVPWTGRIAEIEAQAAETYAFFNNHADGRAAHDAEMFASLLTQRYGERADDVLATAAGDVPAQAELPGFDS
jgi:uncharacterized protein YecE (DUF72 family)